MKLKLQIIFKTITIISILLISIFLLQKISFGSEQTEQTNHAPEFYGTTDITIIVGDELDLKSSYYRIFAKDFEDGNISKYIKIIKNTVNTNQVGEYEICYEVSDSDQNKVEKTVQVHVISDGERKIQRTLYTLPKIFYLNYTGFTRGDYQDTQNLGIYLPENSSVIAKLVNKTDSDLTVQFLNNDSLKESIETTSVSSGSLPEDKEFMNTHSVKVDNTNKIISKDTDKSTTLENVVSVKYVENNTTNSWDKYDGKSFDSIPIIKTLYGDNIEAPVIEITLNDSVKPLDYYTYGDSMDEFKKNWKESQNNVAFIEGNRISFIVPLADLNDLGNSKKNTNNIKYINDNFNNIDDILTYYDNIIEEYDEWIGLSYNPTLFTDLNVKTKYLIKSDCHGYAGAYYLNHDYISLNSPSLDTFLHNEGDGWLPLHEIAHGYQGKLTASSSSSYDNNLKNGKLDLGEVSNNILAYYYQKENLQGSWFGNISDLEQNIMQAVREKQESYLIIGGNNNQGISKAGIYQIRLYAYINLLNKIGAKQALSNFYSYYRNGVYTTDIAYSLQSNYSNILTYGLSNSSQYNVIPYFQNWKLQISKDIEGEIYNNDYPIVYFLRDFVKDDAKAEEIKNDLKLEGIYSLVSNDDISKYNLKGNVNLNLSDDDFEYLKGSNILLKSGKNIVKQVEVNSKSITISDIPVGAYEIEFTKKGKISTQRYLIVKQDETSDVSIELENVILVNIKVTTPPNKTNYIVGQDFEKDGMIVTAFYNDGSSKEVENYTLVSTSTNLLKGQTGITIRYTENGISKNTRQPIKVSEKSLVKIEIETEPSKMDYIQGDTLNTEGLKIKAYYNDDSFEILEEGFSCTPIVLNNLGTETITITYNNFTTTFNVTVKAKSDSETEKFIKGDANGDGKVDFLDILVINKHRLGKVLLTGVNLKAADVTGDKKADFMDILQINKYRLGKIDNL